MGDIDVISWFSCSGTWFYITNFQFQPNLRWSNFWLYYCEIQTLKWWRRISIRARINPNSFFMMFINIISHIKLWPNCRHPIKQWSTYGFSSLHKNFSFPCLSRDYFSWWLSTSKLWQLTNDARTHLSSLEL